MAEVRCVTDITKEEYETVVEDCVKKFIPQLSLPIIDYDGKNEYDRIFRQITEDFTRPKKVRGKRMVKHMVLTNNNGVYNAIRGNGYRFLHFMGNRKDSVESIIFEIHPGSKGHHILKIAQMNIVSNDHILRKGVYIFFNKDFIVTINMKSKTISIYSKRGLIFKDKKFACVRETIWR